MKRRGPEEKGSALALTGVDGGSRKPAASRGVIGQTSLVPKTSRRKTCNAGHTATCRGSEPAGPPHIGRGAAPLM